jgi:hypothetical protein
MEGLYSGPYLNTLLCHTVLSPRHVKQLSQRQRLDQAVHLQDPPLTHLQWILRNISFHDKTNGFLCNKKADEILLLINEFAKVTPEDVPDKSRFLLEINFSELTKAQTYWTLAVDAASMAKALELARGAWAKEIRCRLNTKIASRTKLGITAVQQQIRKDGMHRTTSQSDGLQASDTS